MEQIVRWEKRIGDLCHDQCISLSKDVELFLQLDKSDSDHCAYYFIDHGTRTQFWIDDLGPEGPSLPPIASVPYFSELHPVECCRAIIDLVYCRACGRRTILEPCIPFPDALGRPHFQGHGRHHVHAVPSRLYVFEFPFLSKNRPDLCRLYSIQRFVVVRG